MGKGEVWITLLNHSHTNIIKKDDLLNRLLNNESYFNIEIIALFNHCCLPVTFEFLNGKFPEYEIYQGLFKMHVKKYIYCR